MLVEIANWPGTSCEGGPGANPAQIKSRPTFIERTRGCANKLTDAAPVLHLYSVLSVIYLNFDSSQKNIFELYSMLTLL